MAHRLFRIVAMAWVGSLLTLGYIAAPVIFSMLDRTSAGSVAARLFRIEGMLGVVCGLLLLLIGNRLVRSGFADYKRVRWIVAVMLLCVLIGYFGLQPFMNSLRVAAQEAGTDLAHSAYAKQFGMLHGVSSAFYVVESLLGVLLVWRLPGHFSSGPVVARGQSAAVAARRVRR
jgi:glucan phosphoethanolaminetransferase (alkaline phosphatase superfamily)